jgi:hypothetical protein
MQPLKRCANPRTCEGWHCDCGRHLQSVNVCPTLLAALVRQLRSGGYAACAVEFCPICQEPKDKPGVCDDCHVSPEDA